MSRSTKKGPYVHPSLWEKVLANQAPQNRQIIRTWSRSSVVLPEMVGMTIAVHDGGDVDESSGRSCDQNPIMKRELPGWHSA